MKLHENPLRISKIHPPSRTFLRGASSVIILPSFDHFEECAREYHSEELQVEKSNQSVLRNNKYYPFKRKDVKKKKKALVT